MADFDPKFISPRKRGSSLLKKGRSSQSVSKIQSPARLKHESELATKEFIIETIQSRSPRSFEQIAKQPPPISDYKDVVRFRIDLGPKTVFYGDSLTVGLLDRPDRKGNLQSFSGRTLEEMSNSLGDLLGTLHPKRLVITGGTNNVPREKKDLAKNAADIKEELSSLVQRALNSDPKLQIYVGTLPPVGNRWPLRTSIVDEVNEFIRRGLVQMNPRRIHVIDYYQLLATSDGKLLPEYSRKKSPKNLHPSNTGYEAMRMKAAEVLLGTKPLKLPKCTACHQAQSNVQSRTFSN